MTRFVSIVIVLWGLIVQPLMAVAMPVKMMTDSTHSFLVVDRVVDVAADADTSVHAGHHDGAIQSSEDSPKASCHDNSADAPSSEKCDGNCANGPCSASCAAHCVLGGGVAAFQKLWANFVLGSNTLVITTTKTRSYGFPFSIFHPPKHS